MGEMEGSMEGGKELGRLCGLNLLCFVSYATKVQHPPPLTPWEHNTDVLHGPTGAVCSRMRAGISLGLSASLFPETPPPPPSSALARSQHPGGPGEILQMFITLRSPAPLSASLFCGLYCRLAGREGL